MLIFFVLIAQVRSCADYQPNNPNFYCDDIVAWPVASDIQNNAWQYNKQAYTLYYNLKTKYLNISEPNPPSLDCLAVAREFFCAYSFPYCADDVNDPKRGVCSFLCDIWSSRCPNEEYDVYCADRKSTQCSHSLFYLVSLIVILLV